MRLSGRSQRRRGAAMAEMALVLSLLLTLVLGVIDATRLCMVTQLLTNAARAGCRVAARNGSTPADVTFIVNTALSGSGISPSLELNPSSIQTTQLGDQITLTLSVDYRTVSWLPTPFLYGSTTVTASAVMSSEHQ